MATLPTAAAARDLSDAEFAELDELLANAPEPLSPFDAVMLDGFLCGVLVQPVLLAPPDWLPYAFDIDGKPLPDDVDPAWLERTRALVLRRHAALNRALNDEGWFDPFVLEPDEDAPPPPADQPDPLAAMTPIGRALLPWTTGFHCAALQFPQLLDMPDEAVHAALARLFRHLPGETPQEQEIVATLDREEPLATLGDGIEAMVGAVADLNDLTCAQRYQVDTHRREGPKVGRNDPCPCGSGKKFKHCHGA